MKFTGKGQKAESWLAVAAMGITEPELRAALGYDFFHVMNRAGGSMQSKLKGAGFTVSLLCNFCTLSCVSLLDDIFGFTLKEVREHGVSVQTLLQEELQLYPDHPKLKFLYQFTDAGYAEAEVRAAARETGVPVLFQNSSWR